MVLNGAGGQQTTGGEVAALPAVTVVVPTYNRAAFLRETLDSLVRLDYPVDRLSIIVVDNSSVDNTEEVVAAARLKSPFPLSFYRKENKGPAASRNYAIERATSEIVGFTDSDCIVPPDWVRNAVTLLSEDVGFVAGPVLGIIHPAHPVGFFSHQIFPEIRQENYLYPTANVFYRKRTIDGLGGFSEVFGAYPWGSPVGGEDTDLAWRVKRSGYASAFSNDAPVYHMASPIPARKWLLDGMRALVVPRLAAVYPEIRREFFLGHFLSSFHVFYCAALLAVLLTAVTFNPLFLAMVIPFLLQIPIEVVAGDLKSPKRWWRVPAKYVLLFVSMAVVLGSLLFSSLRYRSLVL